MGCLEWYGKAYTSSLSHFIEGMYLNKYLIEELNDLNVYHQNIIYRGLQNH